MNTKVNKTQAKETAAKLASGVFGTAHFIFDSLAELSMEAEKQIVCKLTDKDRNEVGLNRITTTAERQLKVMQKYEQIHNKLSKAKVDVSTEARETFMRIYGPKSDLVNNNPETM